MARCLVVDDNADVREMLCLMLRRLGQEAVGFEKGAAALAEIASHEFDVTFTDMCMPEMSGADLIRAARKMKLNTRFVLMSGGMFPIFEEESDTNDLDIDACLPKPFTIAEVRKTLDAVLEPAPA